jgi:hypothetical protein
VPGGFGWGAAGGAVSTDGRRGGGPRVLRRRVVGFLRGHQQAGVAAHAAAHLGGQEHRVLFRVSIGHRRGLYFQPPDLARHAVREHRTANRKKRGFGWESSSRRRFSNPTQSPSHGCSPCQGLHARLCCPAPLIRFATNKIAVRSVLGWRGCVNEVTRRVDGRGNSRGEDNRTDATHQLNLRDQHHLLLGDSVGVGVRRVGDMLLTGRCLGMRSAAQGVGAQELPSDGPGRPGVPHNGAGAQDMRIAHICISRTRGFARSMACVRGCVWARRSATSRRMWRGGTTSCRARGPAGRSWATTTSPLAGCRVRCSLMR